MDDLGTKTLALCGLALAFSVYYWRNGQKKDESTVRPLIGGGGRISRCLGSVEFLRNSRQLLGEGYCQNPTSVFRVPILLRDWLYIACGSKHVQEIASAPDHILSFEESLKEASIDYTMGKALVHNPYHISSVRGSLTRSLGRCLPEIHDEIEHAFDDVLALKGNEWKLVQIHDAVLQIVARTSNRLFVGLPLCRNQEYLQLNIDFTVSVFVRGMIISLFPDILKPFVFVPYIPLSHRHVLKLLKTMIDERLEKENQYGRDWLDRPNDLISWLLDHAEGEERTTPALAMRVLVVNFGAIHTSTKALTTAMYDLTAHPQHIEPMREEAERMIKEEGWTKGALARMHKIDSFLRESQRFGFTPSPLGMTRKVVAKDGFTFSDGTTIPHGALLGVPNTAVHRDHSLHPNADTFDGFRFSRMREDAARAESNAIAVDSAEKATPGLFQQHMVSTSPDHLVFGHGRHACPGRFFAAMELKAMLAHILINYDLKAEVEGVRPPDQVFGLFVSPSSNGKIWMRNRERL
ncbi:cytochrome P450 [Mycena leptocephala]|nr:cytochrome P450 [Mycena leptocephala]